MHWHVIVLIGIGLPFAGWLSISVIGLQIGLADVKRRLSERDEQCAAHLSAASQGATKIGEMAEAIARIEGKLETGDMGRLIKTLKVMRGEGTL